MMRVRARFIHHLKVVAAVHLAVLGILLVLPILRCTRERPRTVIPVDFMVMAPPEVPSITPAPAPRPEPPKPRPEPEPAPKPKPRPKPRKEIEISRKRITRPQTDTPQPEKPALSEAEIRRRLDMGARVGDRNTAIPDADARALLRVRDALHAVWAQPSAAEAGGLTVEIGLVFAADGTIVGRSVTRSSGNDALDTSALNAARSVRRIDGLSPDFLRRMDHKVSVSFRVEP